MGWALRMLALLAGLTTTASGLWPLGAICFVYLALSFRPRRHTAPPTKAASHPRSKRYALAGVTLALSLVAFLSGGTMSPILLLAAGGVALLWDTLPFGLLLCEVVPVEDSVLLRSRYLPFVWHTIAEVKPGAEEFPRALSYFTGRLAVFTGTGKAYCLARCWSLGRKEAEAELLSRLRLPLQGAYLLPLEAATAAGLFHLRHAPMTLPPGDLAEAVRGADGIMVFDCSRGVVNGAGCQELRPASVPALPRSPPSLGYSPLLWEVLVGLSKRTGWPDPDAYSNLLESLVATRGEPLGERLKTLEGAGGSVTVESLSGESLSLSRPQLRATVAIYS